MEKLFSLLFSFSMVTCLIHADPVFFINKCEGNDSKCIKETTKALIPIFADGIPELDLKPLDPFYLAKADASSRDLKVEVSDVTVKGVKGCIAKKMQRDVEKSKIFAKFICDLQLDGHYDMQGRLLILSIEGKGKAHVTLKKIVIRAEVDLAEIVKDRKKYWDIRNLKHTYELKDKADVVFENLFNGNDILGQTARELVANNGNDIVVEIGPPIVKAVVTQMMSAVNDFFHKVPIEDLTLD